MQVFFNGSFREDKEVKISFLDPGFLYAEGLFETIRGYRDGIFRLSQHLKRLFCFAQVLRIKIPFKEKYLKKVIKNLVKKNNLSSSYIRVNVWKGQRRINVLIFSRAYRPYSLKKYQQGFSALICRFSQNEKNILSRIKSFNYLLYRLARLEAEERGYDEAILLNRRGEIAEGARSNIFLVKDGFLLTPSLESGCLAGITRQVVLQIARKLKLKTQQRKILPEELFNAEEAFLTSSLLEIMPLVRVNKRIIGNGKKGRLTQLLHNQYRLLTSRESE